MAARPAGPRDRSAWQRGQGQGSWPAPALATAGRRTSPAAPSEVSRRAPASSSFRIAG